MTTKTAPLELRFTSFDETESVLCFALSHRWNGWLQPVIMRTDVEALFSGLKIEFTEGLCKVTLDDGETVIEAPEMTISDTHPEFNGLPAFDFSGAGLCFNDNGPCHF